jgi:hypothetical protein
MSGGTFNDLRGKKLMRAGGAGSVTPESEP